MSSQGLGCGVWGWARVTKVGVGRLCRLVRVGMVELGVMVCWVVWHPTLT